jgi:hypothetical protein
MSNENGAIASMRSAGLTASRARIDARWLTSAACGIRAPLGRPVEPEV